MGEMGAARSIAPRVRMRQIHDAQAELNLEGMVQ